VSEREFWNAQYARRHHAHAPNETLIEVAQKLTPGSALEVGCGEGVDARWLAQHGWSVTGVDISSVAIERARALPSTVEWLEADLHTWKPPGEFDLVTSHFVHVKPEARREFFSKLARAVRRGGSLLFVSHHHSDHSRPAIAELNFTADELHEFLPRDEWQLTYSGERPRGHIVDTVLWATRNR
jgi:2-polyprenyl-3-methyl-5-hydroxy-6-metoxy-1,4-benzoquinol methylase